LGRFQKGGGSRRKVLRIQEKLPDLLVAPHASTEQPPWPGGQPLPQFSL